MSNWNSLSMAQRADVMKLAIENGIYDLDTIRGAYNEFARGGSIHIKPENRGKFTALKKRTGHSATWFKQHGTPAQKKMATFALNARKWKHGYGGNLYEDGSWLTGYEGYNPQATKTTSTYAPNAKYSLTASSHTLPEVVITGKKKPLMERIGDALNPSVMVQAAPGTATGYSTSGAYMPRVKSNVGTELATAATAMASPWLVAPGSSLWMNPLTQQMMAGTAAAEGVNLGTKVLTGRDSFGQLVGDAVEDVSGWNPNSTWWGPIFTESLNPGWWLSPTTFMNPVGKVGSAIENGVDKTVTAWKYRGINAENSPVGLLPNAKPLVARGTPDITAENAVSITPAQWTAAQDAAIARGDMTEAQRLRDLHFKIYQNGDMVDINGNPIHVYHGSPEENITEFYKPNDPRLPTPKGINYKATGEEGIYTSPRKGYAANYMADLGGRYRIPLTKEQKALLKAGKTREEIGLPSIPQGRLYDLYSNTKLVPEDLNIEFDPFTLSTEEAKLIKSKGYSGFDIPGKKYPEHVVLEPNQLKLADAVTYDDNGIRIPLGLRDNFKINDIRYGLLPFLGLGAAGTLYGKQE